MFNETIFLTPAVFCYLKLHSVSIAVWCIFAERQGDISEEDYRRARHVITEIARTEAAAEAFNVGYAQYLGLLTRAFNGEPNLLVDAVGEMFRLKDFAYQLIRQPIGDGSTFNAAPTFEINLA